MALVLSMAGEILIELRYNDLQASAQPSAPILEMIIKTIKKLNEEIVFFRHERFQVILTQGKQLISVLVFDEEESNTEIQSWKKIAKEIARHSSKYPFVTKTEGEKQKLQELKKTMDDIVKWHIQEQAPLEKIKDAFW